MCPAEAAPASVAGEQTARIRTAECDRLCALEEDTTDFQAPMAAEVSLASGEEELVSAQWLTESLESRPYGCGGRSAT